MDGVYEHQTDDGAALWPTTRLRDVMAAKHPTYPSKMNLMPVPNKLVESVAARYTHDAIYDADWLGLAI